MSILRYAIILPELDFEIWKAAALDYANYFGNIDILCITEISNRLNRYHTIITLASESMWPNGDAVYAIRNQYHQVIGVDALVISNSVALKALLAQRIKNNELFGDNRTLSSRLSLSWFSDYQPMHIIKSYGESNDATITIQTKLGAKILSATQGVVSKLNLDINEPFDNNKGRLITIETIVGYGKYLITYDGFDEIFVHLGDTVVVGQFLGTAATYEFKIQLQNEADGWLSSINPTPFLYLPDLRLKSITNGLRLRESPSTTSKILLELSVNEILYPRVHPGIVLQNIGLSGFWIAVETQTGLKGYCAAWLVKVIVDEPEPTPEPPPTEPRLSKIGINLDIRHPLGSPEPNRLGKMNFVRFGYNVSDDRGSEDTIGALNRYLPLMEKYKNAGYDVIFTTSHQTFGEGKNEYWPWPDMTDSKWSSLISRFADMMYTIAGQWANRDIVTAWQIWNEQDAPIGAVASVPMSAFNYTNMFRSVGQAIRAQDSRVKVLTGGFTSGPVAGVNYAKYLVNNLALAQRPDGIAFHPYGRGTDDQPNYKVFGHIKESIQSYKTVMPGKPLWITEWGVLDRPNDTPTQINAYASSFINYIKANYAEDVASIVWYAWAEGMHNGYGLVDRNNQPRYPLYTTFTNPVI